MTDELPPGVLHRLLLGAFTDDTPLEDPHTPAMILFAEHCPDVVPPFVLVQYQVQYVLLSYKEEIFPGLQAPVPVGEEERF